jgi:transposase
MDIDVGVDSHKSSFCAAVVDDQTRTIATREFANTATAHSAFLRWVKTTGRVRVIGIEGSGNYGAGLARFLLGAGIDAVEVPAFLSHRKRKRMPAKGKSDVSDAICIARVVARGEGLAPIRQDPGWSTSSFCVTTVTSSFGPGPRPLTGPTSCSSQAFPATRRRSPS